METIQEEINEQKSSVEEDAKPIPVTSPKPKHQKTYSELNRMIQEKETFINRLLRENNFLKEELEDGKLLIMSISEEAHPNQIIPTLEKPSLNTIEEQAFKIRNLDTGQEMEIKESNINKVRKQLINCKKEIDPWYENFQSQQQILQQKLFKAVEDGDAEVVQHFLDRSLYGDLTPSVNYKGPDNYTALHLAANAGNEQVVAALLDFGQDCDIQAQTASTLKTPLHLACHRGWIGVVRLLTRAGADINFQDIEGNTSLHIACQMGHLEIAKFFLSRKNIKINQINLLGKTPQQVTQDQQIQTLFKNQRGVQNQIAQKPLQSPVQKIQVHSSKLEFIQQFLLSPRSQQKRQQILKQKLQAINQAKQQNATQQTSTSKTQRQESSNQNSVIEGKLSHHSSEDETSANSSTSEKISPENFEIKGQLGKGSFGEVWLVQKKDTQQFYAMKILSKSKIIGHNLVRYAMTERNVLSYSQHPFIVSLNYAFQTKDYLYLIIDYAPCGDLGYHLMKEKRFAEWRARIYICELILALEYLHQRDIIFRDLKPENVVLDCQGHAMLTDFGLSKEGVCFEKQATSFCGSVAYLAPEMLKRQGHGKPVDWYLLGVLLYEMLTGAPPYYSHSKEQLFANIEKGKLRMPNYVSQEARNLMFSLLERKPFKRLGSNGVEEIKTHEFFNGIDWDSVYRRELRPPVPLPKKANLKKPLNIPEIQNESEQEKNKVFGWTFVSKE